ncbi:MAG: D-alanyl-D-alanine carboxypeptidase [Actinobacteria bacterium]|jgi:D-alanyl-D-alanine carboxypeptidase|nr:MAG: D-alanyl-D-alanine carboxypeptidase [Actinomycetota bacterium]
MRDIDQFERPPSERPREELTEAERRDLLAKRIKELRKRKRAQKRKANRPFRIGATILIAAFLLLFLFSSIYVLASSGEDERYQSMELPASNLEELEGMALAPDVVSAPGITAAAAILVDPLTGDVLYEKNADQSLPMASTTKIMTAILSLENATLAETTTISDHASTVGESSAWLEKGEVLSVEQLLYALMLQSANDASVALAEHVGGSEDAFVEMMNAKAAELGLAHTSFSNPHGLDEEGHYTSARDLAAIAAYAMSIPEFREIVATDEYQIPWPGNPYPRVMQNHNKLLEMYPYAIGIKTGYTLGAGKCLVAAAAKEGSELISVILNGGDTYWDQTISLLEYGFNDFAHVEFAYSGQPLAEIEVGDFPRRKVNVVGAQDLVFTVRRDRLDSYRSAGLHYLVWVPYPVDAGQELGYMIVAEGTPHESSEKLISDGNRHTPNLLIRFFAFIGAVFGLWWKGILWLIPGL